MPDVETPVAAPSPLSLQNQLNRLHLNRKRPYPYPLTRKITQEWRTT